MRFNHCSLIILIFAMLAIATGCSKTESGGTNSGETAETGKVPVTTSSDEAKKEFLKGRDLAENLRLLDSQAHFDKAISLDPNFALAELSRANASQTAKDFFEHLKKAVNLADKASDGEKYLILAAEAGANADGAKQKENLDKVVAAYPNDERAHFFLGGYYFGQQDFPKAIEEYKKSTGINPKFAPVYNLLGYAYRQNGDYSNAADAFKKYIELIPDNPNPYDSYAELLLKTGKFDESIAQYNKALSIDPSFNNSHFGISAALTYQGKYDEAAAELQKLTDNAKSDGDKQTALFGLVASNLDKGDTAKALENLDKIYAIAEKRNDPAAMSGNLANRGTVLVAAGKLEDAKAAFEKSLKLIADSDLSQDIKENAARQDHYNQATVALAKGDLETAKKESDEFSKGAEAAKNTGQTFQSHELAGMIAFAEKNYDKAIEEFGKSSLQNPRNLFGLAEAYRGKGDKAKAHEYAKRAAEFYPLPQVNFALVRTKAKKLADETGSE